MTTARALQTDSTPMRELVASEVRGWLGRFRISGAELARRLGKSQTWVARRLDGRQAFDVDELALVAAELGLHVSDFLPTRDTGAVTHVSSRDEQGSVIAFPLRRAVITTGDGDDPDGKHAGAAVPPSVADRTGDYDTAA